MSLREVSVLPVSLLLERVAGRSAVAVVSTDARVGEELYTIHQQLQKPPAGSQGSVRLKKSQRLIFAVLCHRRYSLDVSWT